MAPDVTVMGAGIFGLACAWEMVRRGARVQVIDPHGVGAGASGGIVGALAPHVPENWNPKKAFQLESLLAADAFWAEIADVGGGDPGYGRTGRVQPIADAAGLELARARTLGARQLWQGKAVWEVRPASEIGAWAPVSPTGWVIQDTLSARLHPARACRALARAIRARGGVVIASAREVGPVLWATGTAGLDVLSAGRARPAGGGVKGQAALLRLDRRAAPQLFVEGIHVVPHRDGTVAVGSTTERVFETETGTDALLDSVVAKARLGCPALRDAPVIARWAGVRPRARSRAPMLGAWPDRAGHFVANGGFKIGFGIAPGVARLMADLILEGRDEIPLEFGVMANM